jgi:hypothetical protein
MLTKISAITAAISAALNVIVMLGWWTLTGEEMAAVNAFVLAVGAAVHTWFNPNTPVGVKAPPAE